MTRVGYCIRDCMWVHRRTSACHVLSPSCFHDCAILGRTLRERICVSRVRKSRENFVGRGGIRTDRQYETPCVDIGATTIHSVSCVQCQCAATEAGYLVRTSATPDQ